MSPQVSQRTLWTQPLPAALSDRQVERLQRSLKVSMPWYFNKYEWVVGYRILRTEGDSATYLRITREQDGAGLLFALMTSVSDETATSWEPLRQQVRTAVVDLLASREVDLNSAQFAAATEGAGSTVTASNRDIVVTLSQMIECGLHFGHRKGRWNPKMRPYILAQRDGGHIIDLRKTVALLDQAYDFVRGTVADGGDILLVGTKKHVQRTIGQNASRVGMPFVNSRWPGGMLTNFATISQRIARLKELELQESLGWPNAVTKKERMLLAREKAKLCRLLGGVRDMNRLPSAVWIIDTPREQLAMHEANKLGIPVVAIADTNSNPDEIDFLIPGNDDGTRATGLMTRVISDAIAEGLMERGDSADSYQQDEIAVDAGRPLYHSAGKSIPYELGEDKQPRTLHEVTGPRWSGRLLGVDEAD